MGKSTEILLKMQQKLFLYLSETELNSVVIIAFTQVMNTIVTVLMATGHKVYLNYGVAEGQNLKLIRIGFYAESFSGKYEIYKANTLCSVHTF